MYGHAGSIFTGTQCVGSARLDAVRAGQAEQDRSGCGVRDGMAACVAGAKEEAVALFHMKQPQDHYYELGRWAINPARPDMNPQLS